jgi:hypothetical protein
VLKATLAATVCALVVVSPAFTGSTAARPSLRAAALRPLVVRGFDFVPNERVRLELAGRPDATRRVVAAQDGSFTVRFPVSIGRCARFAVFASGSRRSRASLLPTQTQIDCQPSD